MLKPVLTEKSLEKAKIGEYTFLVDVNAGKYEIRRMISDSFGVNVKRVRTIKVRGEKKKTIRGRIKIIKPIKKAVVTLGEKEKIDLFDTKGK